MRLIDTEPLARDLEEGLAEVYPSLAAFPAPLRLRMGVDAAASIAIATFLQSRGLSAQVITSQPNLDIDTNIKHSMILVHDIGPTTVIDPTYENLLKYAGLNPSYVQQGGLDGYKGRKIASFNIGEEQAVVTELSLTAEYFMNHYQPLPQFPSTSKVSFAGMNDEQIEARLAEFWNSANWRRFDSESTINDIGQRLSRFIVPEHVKLVA